MPVCEEEEFWLLHFFAGRLCNSSHRKHSGTKLVLAQSDEQLSALTPQTDLRKLQIKGNKHNCGHYRAKPGNSDSGCSPSGAQISPPN
jgi:hypothetical protein